MVRIRTVKPLNGLRVRLGFSDGSEGEVDLAEHMWGPIFEPVVRDRSVFESVSVDPEAGTIVWPNGADMDPDILYELAQRSGASR